MTCEQLGCSTAQSSSPSGAGDSDSEPEAQAQGHSTSGAKRGESESRNTGRIWYRKRWIPEPISPPSYLNAGGSVPHHHIMKGWR